MSKMERNKGILVYITDDVKWFATKLLPDLLEEDREQEFREDPDYYGYKIINDTVYEVKWEVERDTNCYDFADVSVSPAGNIHFHTYHYNGGGSLEEVIEAKLREKNK